MLHPLWVCKLLARTGLARYVPEVRRVLGPGVRALRHYSDRLLASGWSELPLAAAFADRPGPQVIDLAAGWPALEMVPSQPVLRTQVTSARTLPPVAGLSSLRNAVAAHLLHRSGLAVDPACEVLITAGALGAVHTVLDALVNRGDVVAVFDPSSPLYPFAARTRRARIRWLPTWNEEGTTRFRLAHLAEGLRGVRVLVLSAPGNPTGGLFRREDIEHIAWWAAHRDVLLLVDETFASFAPDGQPHAGTVLAARDRTLTVGSVSKSHGLPGIRVGWLAGPRELIQACLAYSAQRTPYVPGSCQQVALDALNGESPARLIVELETRRRQVTDRLTSVGLKPTWPAAGFFCWASVRGLGLTGREYAESLLQDEQVQVQPGPFFGPSGRDCIRLSFGGDAGRLNEGLSRLARHARRLQADNATAPTLPLRLSA